MPMATACVDLVSWKEYHRLGCCPAPSRNGIRDRSSDAFGSIYESEREWKVMRESREESGRPPALFLL